MLVSFSRFAWMAWKVILDNLYNLVINFEALFDKLALYGFYLKDIRFEFAVLYLESWLI